MAMVLTAGPAVSLFQAQRRLGALLIFSTCSALAFVLFIAIGALNGGALSVAVAACLHMLIFGPVGCYYAARPIRTSFLTVLRVVALPLLISIACVAPWWALAGHLHSKLHPVLQLSVTGFGGAACYVLAARLFMFEQFKDLAEHFHGLRRRSHPR
jgi:O-antigen/teichoic acid export membrane protein